MRTNMNRFQKAIYNASKSIFAENLDSVHLISGEELSKLVTLFARVKCAACGLYARAILCPPLLAQTYNQFETIDSCRFFYANSVKEAAVFVFKNDGTKAWKRNKKELAHIEFKKRYGRQLKGVENGSAKMINKYMKKLEKKMSIDFNVQALIAGHCDVCQQGARCPNRENPPCHHKGLTSLEATGLDVYGLLAKLKVPFEYPALSYLTQVTLLLRTQFLWMKKPV